MAKAGRKSKSGKRSPNTGRLLRIVTPHDKGNPRVAESRERFGEHYSWPIGRAYAAGLLGHGNAGKDRLDRARKFVLLYRKIIGGEAYRCPLNDTPRGGSPFWHDRDEEWLFEQMSRMDNSGGRPFFDQLISTLHTDQGPDWLDRLLATKRPDPRDRMLLDAALKCLDCIVPAYHRNLRLDFSIAL